MRKYTHFGIETTEDCKVKIEEHKKCHVLWIGGREISIDGALPDFIDIADGIYGEAKRLGHPDYWKDMRKAREDYEQEKKAREGE